MTIAGRRVLFLVLLTIAGCGGDDAGNGASFDRYGGWLGVELQPSSRFRVEQLDGRWWFVTPDGHPFFSTGVQVVTPRGDLAADGTRPYRDAVEARYASDEAWAQAVLARLRAAGLNTIGDFSDRSLFQGALPYTPGLYFAERAPVVEAVPVGFTGKALRDYFAPEFAEGAQEVAETARPCAEDPFCIGVYSDDELPWGVGFAQQVTYLDAYMRSPAGAPGKQAVQTFVEERYGGDLDSFNAVWGRNIAAFDEIQNLDHLAGAGGVATEQAADRRAFRRRVAERYYRVVATALDAVDPAMLYLGDRYLVGGVPPDVVQEAARWVDVVSINRFALQPTLIELFRPSLEMSGQILPADDFSDLDALAESGGKPVLISSFSYRAAGERTPNSRPPFITLPDQTARAAAYESAMNAWLERPYIVGAHWFQYMDQPAIGRAGDGEDNNFGLVDIDDQPYRELFDAMARVAAQIYRR